MLTMLTGAILLASDASIVASTVAAPNPRGIGFTAVKTSTGLYTVTMDDQFFQVQGIFVSLVEGTPTALIAKAKSNYTTVVSQKAGTFQLVTLSGSTPTDVSAASELHFMVNLKNTSVPL